MYALLNALVAAARGLGGCIDTRRSDRMAQSIDQIVLSCARASAAAWLFALNQSEILVPSNVSSHAGRPRDDWGDGILSDFL